MQDRGQHLPVLPHTVFVHFLRLSLKRLVSHPPPLHLHLRTGAKGTPCRTEGSTCQCYLILCLFISLGYLSKGSCRIPRPSIFIYAQALRGFTARQKAALAADSMSGMRIAPQPSHLEVCLSVLPSVFQLHCDIMCVCVCVCVCV